MVTEEDEDGQREQIDEDNTRSTEAMSEEKSAQEGVDTLARFGPGAGMFCGG